MRRAYCKRQIDLCMTEGLWVPIWTAFRLVNWLNIVQVAWTTNENKVA